MSFSYMSIKANINQSVFVTVSATILRFLKQWLKEQTSFSIVNFYVAEAVSFPMINLKPGLGKPRLSVTAVVEGCFQNTIIGKGFKVFIVSWSLRNNSCMSSTEIFCKDEYIFLINWKKIDFMKMWPMSHVALRSNRTCSY